MLKKFGLSLIIIFTLSTGLNSTDQIETSSKKKQYNIGVISITEDITPSIGYKVIQQIESALSSPDVKGVLMYINSGGGNAGTSALIRRSIEELSTKKPVVTLVENICCSGAYLIASDSNWIIANHLAEVGGIGIIHCIERQSKIQKFTRDDFEREIKFELFYKGKEKVIRHCLADELTEEEKSIINNNLDHCYQALCAIISDSRNLPLEKATDWAEGKVFNGFQAINIGLIDEVGGFPEAKAYFKKALSPTTDALDITLSFSLIQ